MIRPALFHDVAGMNESLCIDQRRCRLRTLEIAGRLQSRFHQELAARIRLVAAEVAQLGHVGQLVVDDNMPRNVAGLGRHDAAFGGAITFNQQDVESVANKVDDFRCGWRAANRAGVQSVAEVTVMHLGTHRKLSCGGIHTTTDTHAACDLTLVVLINQLEHAREK